MKKNAITFLLASIFVIAGALSQESHDRLKARFQLLRRLAPQSKISPCRMPTAKNITEFTKR